METFSYHKIKALSDFHLVKHFSFFREKVEYLSTQPAKCDAHFAP